MRRNHESGFTMVELMVTIAIAAILVTVAFPSFQGSLRSNRVATASNELMASFSLARSEAIRSPGGAAVCPSEDGITCGADWNDGWMVWIDFDGDGLTTGANDRVIRYIESRDTLALNATSPGGAAAANLIRFDTRGRVIPQLTRTIGVQPADCPSGQELLRTIGVNLTGQVRIDRGVCT